MELLSWWVDPYFQHEEHEHILSHSHNLKINYFFKSYRIMLSAQIREPVSSSETNPCGCCFCVATYIQTSSILHSLHRSRSNNMVIFHIKHIYRPQRSWANVMFLQVCVILFTFFMLGYHPHRSRHLPEQTPPRSRHPPEQTPPRSRHPLGADTPQEQTWSRHP